MVDRGPFYVRLVVSTLWFLIAACGGPPPVAPIQGALAGATVALSAEGTGPATPAARSAVEALLIGQGFSVVTDPRQPHILTATLRVSAVPVSSIVQVRVGNHIRQSYSVTASLTFTGGGPILEQAATTFSSTDGEVSTGDVTPLVAPIANSAKLAAFASGSASPAPAAAIAAAAPAIVIQAPRAPAFAWPDFKTPLHAAADGANDAALIIGIQDYLLVPKVPGAYLNATDWFSYFVDGRKVPIGQVKLLRNAEATRESILDEAGRIAKLVKPGGRLWVIFIGHGAPSEDGKEGVLVGADAQQSAKGLYARSVRQSELTQALATNVETVMILDACFSGRTGSGQAIANGLQPLLAVNLTGARTTTLLTAGKADEFAGPLPGLDRPAFSYLLLGAMRGWGDDNNDGTVTAREAIDYATKALTVLPIGRSQTPQLVGPGDTLTLARSARENGPNLSAAVSASSAAPPPVAVAAPTPAADEPLDILTVPPTPTPTHARSRSSRPMVGGDAPFDRGAAAASLGSIDVSSCRGGVVPGTTGHVSITFSPTGNVISAIVDSMPLRGTAVAGCVAGRFRAARVPPFSGTNLSIGKAFVLN